MLYIITLGVNPTELMELWSVLHMYRIALLSSNDFNKTVRQMLKSFSLRGFCHGYFILLFYVLLCTYRGLLSSPVFGVLKELCVVESLDFSAEAELVEPFIEVKRCI